MTLGGLQTLPLMFKDLTFEKEWNDTWTFEEGTSSTDDVFTTSEHEPYNSYHLIVDKEVFSDVQLITRMAALLPTNNSLAHTSWLGKTNDGSIVVLVDEILRENDELSDSSEAFYLCCLF